MVVPVALRAVAVSCTVCPCSSDDDEGVMVTVATVGGATVTVIAEDPERPSDVAVITAPPWATAVTNPLLLTRATAELDVLQVTARPVSTLPLASRVVAVS